jgi:hypothetical protein
MWNIIATRKRLLLLALCGVALFAAAAYALTVENVAFGTIAFFEPLHGPLMCPSTRSRWPPATTRRGTIMGVTPTGSSKRAP